MSPSSNRQAPTRKCPRCQAETGRETTTCARCGWIFEDPGAVLPDEPTAYRGEIPWRLLSYACQCFGIALVATALSPIGRNSGLFDSGRGANAVAGLSVTWILIGWGLRRTGPTLSALAGLAAVFVLAGLATLTGGGTNTIFMLASAGIPLGLIAFGDAIGEFTGYIPWRFGPSGKSIHGGIIRLLGWFLLLGFPLLALVLRGSD